MKLWKKDPIMHSQSMISKYSKNIKKLTLFSSSGILATDSLIEEYNRYGCSNV